MFFMGSIWTCSTGATFFLLARKTSLVKINKKTVRESDEPKIITSNIYRASVSVFENAFQGRNHRLCSMQADQRIFIDTVKRT